MISKYELRDMLLKDIKRRKDKMFCLYLHSPFCVRQCSFCMHKGEIVKINGDIYKKYYEEYLPNLIEFYKPVLMERTPDTVYFGGGTSSVMTAQTMRNLFSLIPNFKDIKEKMFECNMILLNDEKVNILKEYNFTHISFGIQSFNERILKKNNRVNLPPPKVKEIVSNLQSQGFFVNCDLMTFIDNGDESDIEDTLNDLIFMSRYVKPNRIDLYPRREALIKNPQRGVEKIICLRKALIKNLPKFNGYILPQMKDTSNFLKLSAENTEYYINYLLYRSEEDFKRRNNYDSSYLLNSPQISQITLGLGAYKHRFSYSYTDEVFVEERNENWLDTVYEVVEWIGG